MLSHPLMNTPKNPVLVVLRCLFQALHYGPYWSPVSRLWRRDRALDLFIWFSSSAVNHFILGAKCQRVCWELSAVLKCRQQALDNSSWHQSRRASAATLSWHFTKTAHSAGDTLFLLIAYFMQILSNFVAFLHFTSCLFSLFFVLI